MTATEFPDWLQTGRSVVRVTSRYGQETAVKVTVKRLTATQVVLDDLGILDDPATRIRLRDVREDGSAWRFLGTGYSREAVTLYPADSARGRVSLTSQEVKQAEHAVEHAFRKWENGRTGKRDRRSLVALGEAMQNLLALLPEGEDS